MLIDTSGLLCLIHKDEIFHNQATEYFMSYQKIFIHNYIIAEFVALANVRKIPRDKVLNFLLEMNKNKKVQMTWIDKMLHDAGMVLLETRMDKTYSLCDAVSFVVMRQYKITTSLTTDVHFEQEGFIRLLK